MALSPVFVELRAATSEFMTKMGEARHEVSKLNTESSGHMKKFAAVGKAALTGIAAGAIAVGVGSVHMADTFELSHAKLEPAIKSTGANFDGLSKPITGVDGRMEKLGFTNAQTEAGLANLTIALHSPAKAMKDVGLAADLARAKNISLADASTAVARAQEGNLRALKSMGIDLPINAKGAEQLKVAQNSLKAATITYHAQLDILHKKHTVTKADLETVRAAHVRLTFAQKQVNEAQHAGGMILDALGKKLGGQAAAAADTFAGKQERAKAMAEDLAAKIGLKLIPVLEDVVSVTVSVVEWFGKHHGVALALAGVIGGVLVASIGAFAIEVGTTAVAGITSMLTSMGLMTVEAEESGAAMTGAFGPIGIAIGLLVVAGYELYKHWGTIWGGVKKVTGAVVNFAKAALGGLEHYLIGPFVGAFGRVRADVTGAFRAITGAVSASIGWVRQHWPLILGIITGPIGLSVLWVTRHWDGVVHFFEGIPSRIGRGLLRIGSAITAPFRSAINTIIGWWNDLVGHLKIPSFNVNTHIPGVGKVGFSGVDIGSHLQIPALASGGVVTRPTLAMIGESGPEAIVPLTGATGGGGGLERVMAEQLAEQKAHTRLLQVLARHAAGRSSAVEMRRDLAKLERQYGRKFGVT
jgi:hypothetical protein